MATSDTAIEADALEKVFPGGVHALRGVSFRIQRGERACLLGPNGAGKTTLIRILMGAFRPTSGEARLFGKAAHDPGFLDARRRAGVVPQSPGMYRDLSCAEYLELVRDLYGGGEVGEVVEAFRLSAFVRRPMATLSGGEQRRLSLGAAVLSKPELLLLDEPTAGLDPVATREVHAWLREMMRGRTVLLCTHNLDEAETLSDSVIILRQGTALVHESLDSLRQRARPDIVLAAVEGAVALRTALMALGREARVDETAGEVRVASDDPKTDAAGLLRALVRQGLAVHECRTERPSLEELFLKIVGGGDGAA